MQVSAQSSELRAERLARIVHKWMNPRPESQRTRSPATEDTEQARVMGSVASVSATMKLTTTTVKVCSTEIKRFAVEGPGHGRRPRGLTGKHDRSPNCPAAMKMNPIG
jgi:hypothetical protein